VSPFLWEFHSLLNTWSAGVFYLRQSNKMTIEEKIKEGFKEYSCDDLVNLRNLIISIYKEALKKQRENCAEAYRSSLSSTDFTVDLSSIENAPEPDLD